MNVIFPSKISTCISNITFIECSANRIKPDRIFRFLKTFMQIFYNGTIKFMQTIFFFTAMKADIKIRTFQIQILHTIILSAKLLCYGWTVDFA